MENYKKDTVIAKAMGAILISEKTLNPMMKKWESKSFAPLNGKFMSFHEFHFRTDWNWVMPVVIKLKLDISGLSDTNIITDLCYDKLIASK